MKPSVLVIDDEKTFRIVVEEALTPEGIQVLTAASARAGLDAWQREIPDVVILDRNLPDLDGMQVLERMKRDGRERGVEPLVVMATAYADVASAVAALKAGAFDYLAKPLQLPELVATVRKALETSRLRAQVRALSDRASAAVGQFVPGDSAVMRQVLDMVDKVAQSRDTTVLIQGESGTGKELIAELIHGKTPGRQDQSFVAFNCASVPEGLVESELFGHDRGAFTDARALKHGRFEEADGGTLFLDEVAELQPGTQAKLLRVLEETTFRRLGGTRDLNVSIRLIAATNKDLVAEVGRGGFRLDLYHRLDVFQVKLPPLRERREDIVPLARHFLEIMATRMGRGTLHFTPPAEGILRAYDYPGNARELRNIVERAVILSGGDTVDSDSIMLTAQKRPREGTAAFFSIDPGEGGTPPSLSELEKAYIARLLEFTGGNRTQVARLLGVSYPTIAKKILDYGL
ncbi:MAG TPA: sigma-54 dependent transcriptional regulator [Polyangia bacterium]|jgi:DNA-binding NtrC family response regulator